MTTPFEVWYFQIPVITRTYATLCLLTTLACQLQIVSPFRLYFNARLIWDKSEYWRLLTNFFYFGDFGLDFFLHMFFLVRYSRMLEEGSFRGRPADFLWMLILACGLITVVALFVSLYFLGLALTFMLVYVWGRRNQHVRMSFLGLFTFSAPFLPWVLLSFALLMGNAPVVDVIGIIVGHIYYFFEDVYPELTGRRFLEAPRFLQWFFGREIRVVDSSWHDPRVYEGEVVPAPADPPQRQPQQQHQPQQQPEGENRRPGGFSWGQREAPLQN